MRVVYKYVLLREMNPIPAHVVRVLHIGYQGPSICAWIDIDPELEPNGHRLALLADGQPIPATARYVGTAVGSAALHVYELTGGGSL